MSSMILSNLKSTIKKYWPFNPHHYLFVVFLLTLFFISISNIAFWKHVFQIIRNSDNLPLSFIISAPITIFLLMYAIFLVLFSWKYVLKPIFVVLLISCAAATYASFQYGIIFDSNMMVNFAETNISEALSYVSFPSILTVVLLGIIPAVFLCKFKIYYPHFFISLFQRVITIIISLAVVGICVFTFYQQYSFIGRDNKILNKKILPISYIYSIGSYIKSKYFVTKAPYVSMGKDAKLVSTTKKPKLMFLVLGETARAQNYSALGYSRETNPYTDKYKVISFANVSSCGTYTAYSVPCMFSNLTRADYSPKKVENRENVLDVLENMAKT